MEEDAAPFGQRERNRADSAWDGLNIRSCAHSSAFTRDSGSGGGFLENGSISGGISGCYRDVTGGKGVA